VCRDAGRVQRKSLSDKRRDCALGHCGRRRQTSLIDNFSVADDAASGRLVRLLEVCIQPMPSPNFTGQRRTVS